MTWRSLATLLTLCVGSMGASPSWWNAWPSSTTFSGYCVAEVDDVHLMFGGDIGLGTGSNVVSALVDYTRWQTLATIGEVPAARYYHACAGWNGFLMIFGGFTAASVDTDVHVLNTETMTWDRPVTTGDTVQARVYHTAHVYNDKLIIYGGEKITGVGTTAGGTALYYLDLNTWVWTTYNGGAVQKALHSAVMNGNILWVFGGGGTASGASNTLHQLNLDTQAWTQELPTPSGSAKPTARRGQGSLFANNRVYVFYGADSGGNLRTDVWAFDVGADKWFALTPTGPPDTPRKEFAVISVSAGYLLMEGAADIGPVFASSLYVPAGGPPPFDGQFIPSGATGPGLPKRDMVASTSVRDYMVVWGGRDSSGALGDLGVYNVATQSWESVAEVSPPGARYGMATVQYNGHVLQHGGSTGTVLRSSIHLLDPDTWTWTSQSQTNTPAQRWMHTLELVVLGGQQYLWMYGGLTVVAPGTVADGSTYLCDPSSWTWAVAAPAGPVAVGHYGHVSGHYDDKVYVYGGQTTGGLWSTAVLAFDLQSSQWLPVMAMGQSPGKITGATSVVRSGSMIVFGGNPELGPASSSVYLLDLESLSWSSVMVAGMASGRAYGALAAVRGMIVVFGGSSGVDYHSDVAVFGGGVFDVDVDATGGNDLHCQVSASPCRSTHVAFAAYSQMSTQQPSFGAPHAIRLGPGVWNGPLAVQGAATHVYGAGVGATTVDGQGTDRCFRVSVMSSAGTTKIEGLTMLGGFSGADGGAVSATSNLKLKDVHMTGNQAEAGGGLAALDTTIALEDVVMSGNVATTFGGALMAANVVMSVRGSVLDGNSAEHGGALFGVYSAVVSVGTVWSNNGASQSGGSLYIESNSVLTAIASNFSTATAQDDGGAVFCSGRRVMTFEGCTLSGNVASSGSGGGVYSECPVLLNASTVTANRASMGGALHAIKTSVTVEDTVFTGNRALGAAGDGAAIALERAAATVKDCTLGGNTADRFGGGMFAMDSTVHVLSGAAGFGGNEAVAGGNIYWDEVEPVVTGTLGMSTASAYGSSLGTRAYAIQTTFAPAAPQSSGEIVTPSVTAELRDYYDSVVSSDSSTFVQIEIAGEILGGALTAVSLGVATFDEFALFALPGGPYVATVDTVLENVSPSTFNLFVADCEPGFYLDVAATVCKECRKGTFSNVSGLSSCYPCPPGSYAPDTEATECLLCEPGQFNDKYEQTACSLCVPGFYASGNGTETCSQCSPGTHASSGGMSACDNCTAGYIAAGYQGTDCSACGMGSYNPLNGSDHCDPCDEGHYAPSIGMEACLPCPTGHHASSPAASECLPCAAGYFANVTGLEDCYSCSKGQHATSTGSSKCTECSPGSATDSAASPECPLCLPGFYADGNSSHDCKRCEPGSHASSSGSSGCTNCTAGYIAAGHQATTCTACLEGSYTPVNGSDHCDPCDEGHYAPSIGMEACLPCPLGYHAPSVSAFECRPCEKGRFANVTGLDECYVCDRGTYASSTASQACTPCDPGFYAAGQSNDECLPCPGGTYNPNNGSYMCFDCPAGHFSAGGADTCTPCDPGSYSSNRSSSCTLCSEGYYAADEGAKECDQCEPGSYAGGRGADACTACDRGTYSSVYKATACLLCSEGTYTNVTGQTVCFDCFEGSAASSRGSFECDPCLPGTYADVNRSTGCVDCPAGTYSSDQGSNTCTRCPTGHFADSVRSTVCEECLPGTSNGAEGLGQPCVPCQANTYAAGYGNTACLPCVDSTSPAGAANCTCNAGFRGRPPTCVECPAGGDCTDPLAMVPAPGFWRADGASDVFYECPNPEACQSDDSCAEGYTGNLCGVCAPNYKKTGDKCEACPPASTAAVIFGVLVVGVIAVLAVFLAFSGTEIGDISESVGSVAHILTIIKSAAARNLKILMSQIQILSQVTTVYGVVWPANFAAFVSGLGFINLDFISLSGVGCVDNIDFYRGLVGMTVAPLVFIILVTLMFPIKAYVNQSKAKKRAQKKILAMEMKVERKLKGKSSEVSVSDDRDAPDAVIAQEEKEARRRAVDVCWKCALFFVILVYPGVSSKIFQLFHCRQVESEYWLYADMSIQCFTTSWTKWAIYGGVMLAMYPLGVPVIFFVLLWRNRLFIVDDTPDKDDGEELESQRQRVKRRLGFIYNDYGKSHHEMYWELLELLRKLVLGAVLVFMKDNGTLQICIALVVCFVAFALHVAVRPFEDHFADFLQGAALVQLYVTFFVGLVIKGEESEGTPGGSDANSDFGLFLIILNASLIVVAIIILVLQIKLELENAREKATKLRKPGNRGGEYDEEEEEEEVFLRQAFEHSDFDSQEEEEEEEHGLSSADGEESLTTMRVLETSDQDDELSSTVDEHVRPPSSLEPIPNAPAPRMKTRGLQDELDLLEVQPRAAPRLAKPPSGLSSYSPQHRRASFGSRLSTGALDEALGPPHPSPCTTTERLSTNDLEEALDDMEREGRLLSRET